MSAGIATDMVARSAKNKNKAVNKTDDMGKPPTICLFLQHASPEVYYALYMIHLPLKFPDVDSDGFVTDPEVIRPVLTFQDKLHFLETPASVRLGSKIYFFGGSHEVLEDTSYPEGLPYKVQVFDTDHPDKKMQTVAPMNGPKESPCVFAADGMIYALGSALPSFKRTLTDCKGSGYFERYHPSSDHWEVLPDPPAPFLEWVGQNYLDDATVVDRRVFISSSLHAVFNLDTLVWEPRLAPGLAARFPFGSLFVEDSASLYHLRGPQTWKHGAVYGRAHYDGERLAVVKTGRLTIADQGDCSLLNSNCLVSRTKQVMVEGTDLDENTFSAKDTYFPWRDLFHMGGRFFCYVATAHLTDSFEESNREPNYRGVFIKFFEEVPADAENCNGERFRSLASFCYKIKTDFVNLSLFTRCSILGSVPELWINAPMKKKLVIMKPKRRSYEEKLRLREALFLSRNFHAVNRETGESEPMKLQSACEEISRLTAVLTEKDKLLKAYENQLAEKDKILKTYEAVTTKLVDTNG